MLTKPKVIVIRAAGTNCDKEAVFAFEQSGAQVDLLHINQFIRGEKKLKDFHILAIPGGFTYGDDIAAGRILANELRHKLGDDIRKFISDGKLIIGICNGFQVLVKSGLLPGGHRFRQDASLMLNDSAKFEDRWVYLSRPKIPTQRSGLRPSETSVGAKGQRPKTKCVWTKDLPEVIYLPIAHAEGKFVVKDKNVLARLKRNNQIVFQYCNAKGESDSYPWNPNGSIEDIAGICDNTGLVFGLMPHPERHFLYNHHPRWGRLNKHAKFGDGARIFQNGVEYAKKHL